MMPKYRAEEVWAEALHLVAADDTSTTTSQRGANSHQLRASASRNTRSRRLESPVAASPRRSAATRYHRRRVTKRVAPRGWLTSGHHSQHHAPCEPVSARNVVMITNWATSVHATQVSGVERAPSTTPRVGPRGMQPLYRAARA